MHSLRRALSTLVLAGTMIFASECSAQNSCEGCQGQCQYCVDGRCTPRAHTFGHYQTQWRRWPEPPPTVPVRTSGSDQEQAGMGDLDLPAVEDEGILDPELPRSREKASGLPPVETGFDAEFVPRSSDPFRDDVEEIPRSMDGASIQRSRYADPQMSSSYQPVRNPLRRDLMHSVAVPVGYEQPVPAIRLAQPIYANPLR